MDESMLTAPTAVADPLWREPPTTEDSEEESDTEDREEEWSQAMGRLGITGIHGELLRDRPDRGRHRWSEVDLGPGPALRLMQQLGFKEREERLLVELAQRRYLTVDQVTLCLYQDRTTAWRNLGKLSRMRFIAQLEHVSAQVNRATGGRHRPPNIYFLDYNGKYYLDRRFKGSRLTRFWRPETIARGGMTLAHRLGVNEVWAHLVQAARWSQRVDRDSVMRMNIGWHDEDASMVIAPGTGKDTRLLKPDAEVLCCFGSTASLIPDRLIGAGSGPGVRSAYSHWESWDWDRATLGEWPTLEMMAEAERLQSPLYSRILVEFETGMHGTHQVIQKIARYNALYKRTDFWRARYGRRFPRVMLVVLDDAQLNHMVLMWRQHYMLRPEAGSALCPVLISSLPWLQSFSAAGAGGVLGRCWINAMRAEGPITVTFGEAMGVPQLAAGGWGDPSTERGVG